MVPCVTSVRFAWCLHDYLIICQRVTYMLNKILVRLWRFRSELQTKVENVFDCLSDLVCRFIRPEDFEGNWNTKWENLAFSNELTSFSLGQDVLKYFAALDKAQVCRSLTPLFISYPTTAHAIRNNCFSPQLCGHSRQSALFILLFVVLFHPLLPPLVTEYFT